MTKEEQKQYDYHKAREDAHYHQKIKGDEALKKEIGKAYQRAYDNIQAEIDGWIGKYAAFENISVEEARKRISDLDVKAFERKAKRYVEDRDFSKRANEELRLYNLTMKVNRQELLKRNIGLELIGLADKEDKILRKSLMKLGEDELVRQAGILGMGAAQKERMARGIGQIVDGDFHSATFSDRIWTNQSALRRRLEDGIDRTILRGENPTVWARKLKNEIGEGFKNAKMASERIAVTESARVQVQIATKSFEDMGYEQMIVICEPGACHICKPHDKEIVSVEDAEMGKNIPLWHPYCRCSVAAWMNPLEVGRAKAEHNIAMGGDHRSLEASLGQEFFADIAEYNKAKGIDLKMMLETNDRKFESVPYSLTRKILPPIHDENVSSKMYWVNKEGVRHNVDGVKVVLDYKDNEKADAVTLSKCLGTEVIMVPRVVNPKWIKTPDFEIYDRAFDLKTIIGTSKNSVDNAIKGKKEQAKNFVINISNTTHSEDDIEKQIDSIYKNKHRDWVDSIIVIKNGNVVMIFKRKTL